MLLKSVVAEASCLPSRLKVTQMTGWLWPLKVRISRPVLASQIFTVVSSLAEARDWPSGLKATRQTSESWAGNATGSRSLVASQTVTFPSWLPEATHRPSGLNAALSTAVEWLRGGILCSRSRLRYCHSQPRRLAEQAS